MAIESTPSGRRLILEEAVLREQLAGIRAERAQLDARERAILGALDLFENGVGGDSEAAVADRAVQRPSPSQREMIRRVLEEAGSTGAMLSVSEIIAGISRQFGMDLARTSVSPTLAKMEAAGEVRHVGRTWGAIRARGRASRFEPAD